MTGRRRGIALLALLTSALVIGPAVSAQAAAKGRILQVTSSKGQLTVLFSGAGFSTDQRIDPTSVTMTVDGLPVHVQAHPVEGSAANVKRTAIVAIDTSGSMKGPRLDAAKSAATTFVDSLPADVSIGLVTFSTTAVVRLTPTTSHAAVAVAISNLAATGNTALYDGSLLSLRTAGTTGARTVLLLSDGVDDGSRASLAGTIATVKQSGIQLSAVALGAEAAGAQPLAQIAASSGGTVLPALKADDLAGAFQSASQAISTQLVLTATVPPGAHASGNLVVTAKAGTDTLTDTAFTTFTKAPSPRKGSSPTTPQAAAASTFSHSWTLYAATAALFFGLLLVLVIASTTPRLQSGSSMGRRLSVYTLTGRTRGPALRETSVIGDSAVARTAMEFADRIVAQRGLEATLERRLDAAGVPLRAAEWLLLHAGAALGLGILAVLLSSADPVATVLGFLVGALGPYFYLRIKRTRRINAFLAQLPDTLQLVAGSLSSGYSLPQALDSVVRESSPPVSQEFNRAFVESRLGVPIDEALDGISQRMESEDFGWVVMAIRIQSEVGGNLSEVLQTVSNTLRERERLRRQVSVLSAEGRLSAYILGALPPVFAIYLLLARRAYIEPLFTDPIGVFMLIVTGALMAVGAFWLSRVVKVKV